LIIKKLTNLPFYLKNYVFLRGYFSKFVKIIKHFQSWQELKLKKTFHVKM